MRIGFDAFWSEEANRRTQMVIPDHTGIHTVTKEDGYQFSIQVLPQYVKYLDPNADVNLYIASGLHVSFDAEHGEDADGSTSTDIVDWRVGPSLGVGAEWFAAHNISFNAEYAITLLYDERTATTKYLVDDAYFTKNRYESNVWHFDTSSARLGLSLYF